MSSQRPPEPVATPSQTSGTRLDWTLFVLLSFMWGSSYLFIKIGVDEGLRPLTLIMLRLLFGTLLLVARLPRRPSGAPDEPAHVRPPAGHVAVLDRDPVLAHHVRRRERRRFLGRVDPQLDRAAVHDRDRAAVPARRAHHRQPARRAWRWGSSGVVILTSGDLGGSGSAGGISLGIVALLLSAVSYAVGAVYARRNARGLSPMTIALFQVLFAFAITTTLAFAIENPLTASITPAAAFSVVWLGLFGSGMAYLLFFRLLGDWGPTRTSLVAYLLPVWGILLGVAVLQETVDARVLLGTALIVGGVALVNARFGGATAVQALGAGGRLTAQASSARRTAPATIDRRGRRSGAPRRPA